MKFQPDPKVLREFLAAIMPEDAAIELRVFHAQYASSGHVVPAERYSATLAGWYNDADSLVCDAQRLRGISGFITINPVDPSLLGRSLNRLSKCRNVTSDDNVLSLRWLYIDIDAVRPAGISSSDAEWISATQKRDVILAENPELAAASLWGSSGNGAWIFARLPDLPNDDASRGQVAATLGWLAAKYSDGDVAIDVSTKNPSRVAPLPGTWKCKGFPLADRPWRPVTFDGRGPVEPLDLTAWLAARAPEGEAFDPWSPPADLGGRSPGQPTEKFALEALRAETIAVSTEPPGNRNNRLNLAAVRVGELVAAGALPEDQSRLALAAAARAAGLDDHDIAATVESGFSHGKKTPRDLSHVGNGAGEKASPPAVDRVARAERMAENADVAAGMEDNPNRLARLFLRQNYEHPDGATLRRYRDEWYEWKDGRYRVVPEGDIAARLSVCIAAEFERLWALELMRAAMAEEKKVVKPRPVTTSLVANVLLAMSGICLLPSTHEAPEWLAESGWPAKEVLPTRNAIIHLPTYLEGGAYAKRPTPQLFNLYGLPYDFSARVGPPENWLNFLGSLWENDQESIDTLQEWFGLNLVADTSFQKILLLIGPPRSGKGTIGRALQSLVGIDNAAGPTLASLEDRTGLEPLIDKLTAVVGDARLSGRSDQSAIVERLLSISGEDRITIDRKYRSRWTGRITARFSVISNELPRFLDASGALSSRLVVLKLTRSFRGHEDRSLEHKIAGEMTAILRWAIEGWKRLKDRGYFIQPTSAEDLVEEMEEIVSPAAQFVRECCVVGPDETVSIDLLFETWKAWCSSCNRNPGDKPTFGRNLRAAIPELKDFRPGGGSQYRIRSYRGIGLPVDIDAVGQPQAYEADGILPF